LISHQKDAQLEAAKQQHIFKLAHREGQALIKVTVAGYDSKVIGSRKGTFTTSTTKLNPEFEVTLRNNVQLIPSKVSQVKSDVCGLAITYAFCLIDLAFYLQPS